MNAADARMFMPAVANNVPRIHVGAAVMSATRDHLDPIARRNLTILDHTHVDASEIQMPPPTFRYELHCVTPKSSTAPAAAATRLSRYFPGSAASLQPTPDCQPGC